MCLFNGNFLSIMISADVNVTLQVTQCTPTGVCLGPSLDMTLIEYRIYLCSALKYNKNFPNLCFIFISSRAAHLTLASTSLLIPARVRQLTYFGHHYGDACMCVCVCVKPCLTLCKPIRLLYPWNFSGKNTGISCHFLIQGIFLTQGSNLQFLHVLN